MSKGVTAHDEQFLLWPQCFQLYLIIKLSFVNKIQVFVNRLSKSSAADLLYMGKVERVENIVAKGEIAQNVSNVVFCRCIRKCLYVEMGQYRTILIFFT